MAGGEVGKGGCDAREELDLLVGDGLGEAGDALVLGGGDGGVGELLEAGDERLAEAVEAVAVGADGGVLDVVEMATYLFGGVDAVVEVGDEAGDGALEVDVVFPERVVGVDEQGLIGRVAEGRGWERVGVGSGSIRGRHTLIIRWFREAFVTKVAVEMPRLGDVCPGWGVPDWKQWLIQILHDLMDWVRGGRLMIAELQPMWVIECGIRSRRSCESMRVDGMMKS